MIRARWNCWVLTVSPIKLAMIFRTQVLIDLTNMAVLGCILKGFIKPEGKPLREHEHHFIAELLTVEKNFLDSLSIIGQRVV